MERQRGIHKLTITSLLLVLINVCLVSSSSKNFHAFANPIGVDSFGTASRQTADHVWLQPVITTTSIFHGYTTHPPPTTTTETEEILESSESSVQNRYEKPSSNEHSDEEEDGSEESPDHVIPYSPHEEEREVPTRPKYVAPGLWAKPPADKDVPLDFVPTKLHAQVRGTHTVKRLPQQEAIKSAKNDEERRNAPRLREVVTNSKVNTVYTEEGYEDSAYDHAGRIRDADFHEGFARKLHEQEEGRRESSSGNNKHGKLVPDEFKEYDEDYQDHLEENEESEDDAEDNDENNSIGYGRQDIWESSKMDPEFVVRSGFRKLKEDIDRDAEESERDAKIYQKEQESRIPDSAENNDSSESKESQEEESLKDEENKPITIRNEESNDHEETTKSRVLEQKENEDEVDDETPASPRGFTADPLNSPVLFNDRTTSQHAIPPSTISSREDDESTTSSYSQLFWDYFKKLQPSTTEPNAFILNSTISNSQLEQQTPIAVATIDGHGPYLLVKEKEETTTSPSTFFNSFHPQGLFSNRLEFELDSSQGHHPLEQNNVDDNNVIVASTIPTFSAQPFLHQPLESLKSENEGSASSADFLSNEVTSTTPAVTTLNFTNEAFSHIDDYQKNPFLSPILDNSKIAVTRKKSKYRVLVRPKPKESVKPVAQQSSHQQAPSSAASAEKDEGKKKIRDFELSAKYIKMLDYLKNKQKIKPLAENKKKLDFTEDLTVIRPPTPQLGVAYPIFPTYRPAIANKPSVSIENAPFRETTWRSGLRDQYRSHPTSSPFRLDPIVIIQPVHLTYRKNPLPATDLLPPPFANVHADYHVNEQNDDYLSYIGGRPQKRDNAFRYYPSIPEASWKRRSRRKRFVVNDDDGDDVKAESNNGTTNSGKVEQRDIVSSSGAIDTTKSRDSESVSFAAVVDENRVGGESENAKLHEDMRATKETAVNNIKLVEEEAMSLQKGLMNDTNFGQLAKMKRSVSSRNRESRESQKSGVNRKEHEELLNEAPKISGSVIDDELAERFNGDARNGTSAKGKVEVEVPSFDYVEEIIEDSPSPKSPTTTKITVDSQKYPFYKNDNVPVASALKYAVDPRTIPRKTSRGMEFYASRNAYKECDEVQPNLDKVLPEKEEPDPERESPQGDLPRLRGLGDKLDCFKAKYFDEDPLDNPLYAEKLIVDPTPPPELDPVKFASKVMLLPEEDDDYVVPRVSKKPERSSRQWRNRKQQHETQESIRVNYKHDPKTGRGRNAYLHSVRGSRYPLVRRQKHQRSKLKSTTTTTTTPSPKQYDSSSYENQVYEDVMGNIRNMASNAYQVYEVTTLPAAQVLAVAGSENSPKFLKNIINLAREKKNVTMQDVANTTSSVKSSEIKGLLPPPKFSTSRQANYRKYRPISINRVSILRSPSLPRIIAHHHNMKINKRSVPKNGGNSSEGTNDEDEKRKVEKSTESNPANDTVVKTTTEEAILEANATSAMLDLMIEESKPIPSRSHPRSTPRISDTKRRRNSTSNETKNAAAQKVIYTIRDRIRYSKPKWHVAEGFGKFSTSPRTVDEDSRRKEPRYKNFERKRPIGDDTRNDSATLNSFDDVSTVANAASESKRAKTTTEIYYPDKYVKEQTIYGKKIDFPEPDKAESIISTRFEENVEEKDNKKEDEEDEEDEEDKTERVTNAYRVHEDINEDQPATTAKLPSPLSSDEVLGLQKYLETDPPGYAEAFSEETTESNKQRADSKQSESEEDEEKDEETDHLENVTNPWEGDSSEKVEEQVETSKTTRTDAEDDPSVEDFASKEEESTSSDQAYFTRGSSSAEGDKDDDHPEKEMSFLFSRYKPQLRNGKDDDEDSEESKERSGDYVFPWHADKKANDRSKRLRSFRGFEYPWETRERLARERRKRKRTNKYRNLFPNADDDQDNDDEDEEGKEEESQKQERPVYAWEKYDLPQRKRVNSRRYTSPKKNDDDEEASIEETSVAKFSSRYRSAKAKPYSARDISRSIKKVLEEDVVDENSKEEISKETSKETEDSSTEKPSFSSRGISRGMLVPEDITQSPRRKTGRTWQADKNVLNNSPFDSRKHERESDEEEEEEEEEEEKEGKESAIEYLKSEKNDLNDQQMEAASSRSTNVQKGTSSSPQSKKRRRRISKNNSTITLDNTSAESITASTKRRRRKPSTSTITPDTTSSTNVLETSSKLPFKSVQRRYSKASDIRKTSRSNPSERVPSSTVRTNEENDFEVETSTPKTRTIEHRSRVSKEKVIRKTTYPGEESFKTAKRNATSARQESVRVPKIKLTRRTNNNNNDNNYKRDNDKENSGEKEKSMKRKERNGKGVYNVEVANEDSTRSSVTSERSKVINEDYPLKGYGMRKEEVKMLNDFSTSDAIATDEDDSSELGDTMTSETYVQTHVLSNQLQNIPPRRRNNRGRKKINNNNKSSGTNEGWEDKVSGEMVNEETKERQESSSQVKFIKDPQRRLYYYVE